MLENEVFFFYFSLWKIWYHPEEVCMFICVFQKLTSLSCVKVFLSTDIWFLKKDDARLTLMGVSGSMNGFSAPALASWPVWGILKMGVSIFVSTVFNSRWSCTYSNMRNSTNTATASLVCCLLGLNKESRWIKNSLQIHLVYSCWLTTARIPTFALCGNTT